MTITYTSQVASCKGFGCFWKLLFRWRGSIYKLVWPELLFYSFLYYTCSAVYRFALDETQKRMFEKVSLYCQFFIDLIPVSFVLGFYVSIVVQRWWDQYMSLPWPDALALFVSTSIHGQDERSRLMRRTVMRYANLTQALTLIMISPTVKKRFPTLDHLVEAGFMTANEKKIFDSLDEKTPHPKYWMPLVWAGSIVARARKEGRIRDDFAVKTILDEINRFRGLCGGLLSYDWISIPLVYTQVVTLAVYTFFLGTLMGRQFLDPLQQIPNHNLDFYVPVFTLLQFFFYMGWLKVAESLVNPFGEDDDDFEVNWLVDRNLQVSYLIVDEMHSEHPELVQDMYWDEIFPQELPYTVASEQFRREPPQGSTAHIEVTEADQEFLPLLEEQDDEEDNPDMKADLENGGSKAINITKKNSVASSVSGTASSQYLTSRKPSMLSMLMQRVRTGSTDNFQRRSRQHGSTASMRHLKKQRGLRRSSSRVSSTSQVAHSPESVVRNPTIMTQDSAIFRMSDLSLNTGLKDDIPSPRPKTRHPSCEDDEPILIKIKRRDKSGRVISPTELEIDVGGETVTIPTHYKNDSDQDQSNSDDVSENTEVEVLPRVESDASIRTSIFQGEGDDSDPAERTGSLYNRRKGLNLRGASLKKHNQAYEHGEGSPGSARSFSHRRSRSPTVAGTSPQHFFLETEDVRARLETLSASEPVSPAHKSPIKQCREAKSLAALQHTPGLISPGLASPGLPSPAGTSRRPHLLSPIGRIPSMTSEPFSGDLALSTEDLSPQKERSEESRLPHTPGEDIDGGKQLEVPAERHPGDKSYELLQSGSLEPIAEERPKSEIESSGESKADTEKFEHWL